MNYLETFQTIPLQKEEYLHWLRIPCWQMTGVRPLQ